MRNAIRLAKGVTLTWEDDALVSADPFQNQQEQVWSRFGVTPALVPYFENTCTASHGNVLPILIARGRRAVDRRR